MQEGMFSYVSAEKRVPQDHPLRRVRALVDAALKEMSPQFGAMYSRYGRPSIRRRSCCGRCCCSFSIACAASGC